MANKKQSNLLAQINAAVQEVDSDTLNDPESRQQDQLKLLRTRYTLISVLVGVIALAAVMFIYLPIDKQRQIETRTNDIIAEKQASADAAIQQLINAVDGVTLLPAVHKALSAKSPDDSKELTDQILKAFAKGKRLKIIPLNDLGIAKLGEFEKLARNNIEKDMLRRAANQEDMLPEVYIIGGEVVISLARPIVLEGNDSGKADGAILLTLDANWLIDTILPEAMHDKGKVELFYQSHNTGQVEPFITSSNTALTGHNKLAKRTPLKSNKRWILQFTPAQDIQGFDTFSYSVLIPIVCLSFLIQSLVVAFHATSIKKVLENNFARLSIFVTDAFKNFSKPIPDFDLPEIEPIATKLSSEIQRRFSLPDKKIRGNNGAKKLRNKKSSSDTGMIVEHGNESLDHAQDEGSLTTSTEDAPQIAAHIFRAYDIRGQIDVELDDEVAYFIGRGIGSIAREAGVSRIVVGRDGRHSSDSLQTSLSRGLLKSGCDVIDVGLVPTPVVYFAAEHLGTQSAIMVTGSHNPPEYNGFKIVLNGNTLAEDEITAIAERIANGEFIEGRGELSSVPVMDAYIDQVTEDVVVASPMRIVIDCGNGATGEIAPLLFASLGCEVIPLYNDIDGDFPNHHPDPSKRENLEDLIVEVKNQGADLGIAFDGDGDRLVAVTGAGEPVNADQLLMLYAQDVITRNPGADVIYDVKCSKNLSQIISRCGGRPTMWKTGHSLIKRKMKETGALLGGEFSGHIFFKERWFGFDDGLYSGARLLELLSLNGETLASAVDQLPKAVDTPEIQVPVDEADKFDLVAQLANSGAFGDAKLNTIDGVRVEYSSGWGLV
ncbi:phosphomannomutase/phosphoglucomutase, partial [bacterium]|nr:phosphomannomutase/phosphoglucomutase [bacterium]